MLSVLEGTQRVQPTCVQPTCVQPTCTRLHVRPSLVHVVLAAQAQAVVDRVLVVGFQIRDDRRFVKLAQQLDVQLVHVRRYIGPALFQQIRHVARCR